MIDSQRAPGPETLVVNEACWVAADKIYALRLSGDGIVGLRVRGQITGKEQFNDPEDPMAYVRPDWLQRYGAVNLADPAALQVIDKRNFHLSASEVAEARLHKRRRIWTGAFPNSGIIKLKLLSKKRRNFILIGRQDHAGAIAFFARAGIEVTD